MQIVFFLIVILLLLLMLVFKGDSFSSKSKRIFLSVIFFLISIALSYEFFISKQQSGNRELMNAFYQGKNLVCEGQDINSTRFRLVSGTLTFVGKDGIKELKGIVIPVSKCRIK